MDAHDAQGTTAGGAGREAGPTMRARPRDYAVLSMVFAAVLTVLALLGRRNPGGARRADSTELPAMALATFGLARIVVHEKVTSWARQPFVEEHTPGRPPRGSGPRAALGELLTCTRCTGVWTAAFIAGARVAWPSGGRMLIGTFAAAGANDLLQAGFRVLQKASR